MSKIIELSLPEFAWIDGGSHEKGGNPLENRMIVLHVRSASVIEFFERGDFVPNGDVITYDFTHKTIADITERYVAVLHYCAATTDRQIIDEILKSASAWYLKYLDWEDANIVESEIANRN